MYLLYSVHNLRRIYTEAKAKVAASVFFGWGGFIQFLATLAILPRSIWKNWLFGPPNRRDDLCLCFCINPSSMLYTKFLHYQQHVLQKLRSNHNELKTYLFLDKTCCCNRLRNHKNSCCQLTFLVEPLKRLSRLKMFAI